MFWKQAWKEKTLCISKRENLLTIYNAWNLYAVLYIKFLFVMENLNYCTEVQHSHTKKCFGGEGVLKSHFPRNPGQKKIWFSFFFSWKSNILKSNIWNRKSENRKFWKSKFRNSKIIHFTTTSKLSFVINTYPFKQIYIFFNILVCWIRKIVCG